MLTETVIQTKIPVEFGATLKQVYEDQSRLFLNFLASTTDKSLSDHQMMETAIEDMKQIATEHNLPTFIDHDSSKDFGQIVDVAETGPNEFRPIVRVNEETGNPIIDAPVLKVKQWIKEDANMGASIGGIVTKLKIEFDPDTDEITFNVHNIRLYEMSATLIPALPGTRGEVTVNDNICPDGFCGQINRQVQNYLDDNPNMVAQIKQDMKQSTDDILYKKYVTGTWNWKEQADQIDILPDSVVSQTNSSIKSGKKPIEDRSDKMDEEMKKILENMNKNVNTLMEERNDRIEQARIKKEKEEAEKKQNEVLEALVEKASEVIAEKVDEIVNQKLETIVKDRNHTKQSSAGTKIPADGEKEKTLPENIAGIPTGGPAEYMPHIGGIVQNNAMTPQELAARFG